MIIEIVLNVIVIILLKQYMDRKLRLSTLTQDRKESDKRNKKDKTMRNNLIIAVIRGFMSIILHIITFMVNFILF